VSCSHNAMVECHVCYTIRLGGEVERLRGLVASAQHERDTWRAEVERLRARLAEAEGLLAAGEYLSHPPAEERRLQGWGVKVRAFLSGKPNDAAQAAARTLLGDEGEATPSPTVTLRETDTHLVISQRGSEVVLTRGDALKLAEGIRLVCGKEG